MVFHLDCEALVAGIERGPLGNGPGLEDAVELQPKIIVQPRRVVLLNDKAELIRRLGSAFSRRFASLGKIPFGEVCRELVTRHAFHQTERDETRRADNARQVVSFDRLIVAQRHSAIEALR